MKKVSTVVSYLACVHKVPLDEEGAQTLLDPMNIKKTYVVHELNDGTLLFSQEAYIDESDISDCYEYDEKEKATKLELSDNEE